MTKSYFFEGRRVVHESFCVFFFYENQQKNKMKTLLSSTNFYCILLIWDKYFEAFLFLGRSMYLSLHCWTQITKKESRNATDYSSFLRAKNNYKTPIKGIYFYRELKAFQRQTLLLSLPKLKFNSGVLTSFLVLQTTLNFILSRKYQCISIWWPAVFIRHGKQ